MKPEYKIKVIIYDETTGEDVAEVRDSLNWDSSSYILTYDQATRVFERNRPEFEATHYPTNTEEPDPLF